MAGRGAEGMLCEVKTILILEDEPLLMNLLHRVLSLHGYAVLEAVSPEEAIRQFHDNGRKVDLLIADVTMAGVSGVQIAVLFRAELPGLRVILTSGYPLDAWSVRDSGFLRRLGSDSVSILLKPFMPKALLHTIGGLIGAPESEMLSASIA
jgi:DNA-binding response OmpR family regulator